jgi:hypothetical protein
MGAAEDGIAGEEVIAFFQEAKERGYDGTHARGGGEAVFGPFQGDHAVYEFLYSGVAEAAVDISVRLIGEGGPHLLGVVEAEAAGEKKRRGMLILFGAVGTDANGLCDTVLWHM